MLLNKKSGKKSGLVLLSGGQDSTTCLAIALNECSDVYALLFNYGQRHDIELQQAKKIAALAGVSFQLVDAQFIAHLNKNSLTDSRLTIVQNTKGLPNTFVPGRNLFFFF